MYICVCNAVTERQIEQAAREGARRLRDLREQLGVTSDCKSCAGCALKCLRDCHARDADTHQAIGRASNEGRQTRHQAAESAAHA
ncbi:(2Fe-2S)-binding protein [Niveibacterium sp. SC-1]|uniref:(2Fe-2S)-binding protein n=1 Tax=Niveibacterium sp. SC-1 TaxID=3135646 RepID=UPI00311E8B88